MKVNKVNYNGLFFTDNKTAKPDKNTPNKNNLKDIKEPKINKQPQKDEFVNQKDNKNKKVEQINNNNNNIKE